MRVRRQGWKRVVVCLLAMLAGGACAGGAVAGTIYRCDGAGGRSYSNNKVPGARCTVIGTYKPVSDTPAPAAKSSPSASTSAPTSSADAPAAASSASGAVQAPKTPRFLRMASSTTYSYIDANGVRNFSNRRPLGVANVTVSRIQYAVYQMETCYACGVQPALNFGRVALNTSAYQSEIANAAKTYGVDEAVVRAIIHAESAFHPNALSRAGAQGLMQLMPDTARRFGVANAFDAAQNIRGGVQYLAFLLKRFNGDLRLAAAGYNAGENAVDRYAGVPPYSETRRYVERVAVLAQRYRGSVAAK